MIAATSSRAALPARSPIPCMETSTWRAPPCTPASLMQRLRAGDAELGFEVQVAGGEKGVDAVRGRGFHGARGGFDVAAPAAGERGDARAANLARNGLHAAQVAIGRDGETGFDDIDAESGEPVGEAQLLLVVHGAAGGLLAVAQGGVEEEDLFAHGFVTGLGR